MTPRENLEKMFQHEVMEYIPHFNTDIVQFADVSVERLPFQTGKDAWGCNWISCEDSMGITHPDITDIKFRNISEWREKALIPDLDAIECNIERGMLQEQHFDEEMRKEKMLCYVSLNGIFERSHILMGFEDALCEFMRDPEEYGKMLEAFADHKIRLFKKMYDLFQPDILLYHDDMATQQFQFLPTRLYVDYIFPQYKRMVDAAKEIGYQYVVHHSCGRIEDLFPEWIKCGFDGIDSFMICNDLRKIKETYGEQLVFWPGGDTQHILGIPNIGAEKIEKMVLDYYDMLCYDGKGLCMDTTFQYSMNPANEAICTEMQMKHRKAYIDAVKRGEKYSPASINA